jgi:hypothetical protein
MSTTFRNPTTGHVEEVSDLTWLWSLLFGLFFFMYKGLWRHVLIQFGLVCLFYGMFGAPGTMFVFVTFVVYAAMARGIVEAALRRDGYVEGAGTLPAAPISSPELSRAPKMPNAIPDDAYAAALDEWSSSARQPGLWARLFTESNGDESRAKAAYLAARAPAFAPKPPAPPPSWATNEPLPKPPPP